MKMKVAQLTNHEVSSSNQWEKLQYVESAQLKHLHLILTLLATSKKTLQHQFLILFLVIAYPIVLLISSIQPGQKIDHGFEARFKSKFLPICDFSKSRRNELTPNEYFELLIEDVIGDITNMFNLIAVVNKGDQTFITNSDELKCWLGILLFGG